MGRNFPYLGNFLIFLVCVSFIASCIPKESISNTSNIPTLSPISTEILSTQFPTAAPTATPEPLSVDDFKVVDGQIQEKVDGSWQAIETPAEIGGTAYVELHEGKMYGIDTMDRAMMVRDGAGEWVKFERPIVGLASSWDRDNESYTGHYEIDLSNVDLTEVPLSEISRLQDSNGSAISWGYQEGSYNWKDLVTNEHDPLPANPSIFLLTKFSGYFLGVANCHTETVLKTNGKKREGNSDYFLFEIPLKYERQIILLHSVGDGPGHHLYFGDKYSDDLSGLSISEPELFSFIKNNLEQLRGQQVVLDLRFFSDYKNDQEFWKNVIIGKGFDTNYVKPIFQYLWVGEEFRYLK